MRAIALEEAIDCGGGKVGLAGPSSNNFGDGTVVGTLVSMKTRSGGAWRDAIRITGLIVSLEDSVTCLGKYQSAKNRSATSEAPPQPMYCNIGIAASPFKHSGSKRRNP
jgi:hypothetical protein